MVYKGEKWILPFCYGSLNGKKGPVKNCWENTDGIQKGAPPSSAPKNGAPPFQCSPESDLDFHVDPNELHIMVCLGRP